MNRYGVLIGAAALVIGLTQVTPLALAHGHGGGGHGGGHSGGHGGGGHDHVGGGHYHDHDHHHHGGAAAVGFGVGAAYASDRNNNVCPPPGESNQYSENYPGTCPDASDSTLVDN